MNCKEAEQQISSYLNEELGEKETKEFLTHMKSCDSCYEEMEITYMASIGLERLESASSLDINKEMHRMLQHSEKKLKKRRKIKIAGVIVNALVMVSLVITLLFQITLWVTGDMPKASFFGITFSNEK